MKLQLCTRTIAVGALCAVITACVRPATAQNSSAEPAIKSDPAAYALLRDAFYRRCSLPKEFTGLTADVTLNDNGVKTTGTLSFTVEKGVDARLAGADPKAQSWLQETLTSAIEHRLGGDFAKGDGSHSITFTSEADNGLGRQVSLNDELKSLYRIRDNQIMEVTRTMGDLRLTITMMENAVVDGDKYLPKHFMVTYFNARTGALQRTECFTDSFTRMGAAWVPTGRRVIAASSAGMTTRSYELKNVHLLTTRTAAATQ